METYVRQIRLQKIQGLDDEHKKPASPLLWARGGVFKIGALDLGTPYKNSVSEQGLSRRDQPSHRKLEYIHLYVAIILCPADLVNPRPLASILPQRLQAAPQCNLGLKGATISSVRVPCMDSDCT